MNPNSPINKNREAYRRVVEILKNDPRVNDLALVRNLFTNFEQLRVNQSVYFVSYSARGPFPSLSPMLREGERLIILCPASNQLGVYQSAGDHWVRVEF